MFGRRFLPAAALTLLAALPARATRATPLVDWVAQGKGGAYAVYRMEDLSGDQALAVTEAAAGISARAMIRIFTSPKTRSIAANSSILLSGTARA